MELFHDLKWNAGKCDGLVCLLFTGRLVWLQEGGDLGTAPYVRELEQAETDSVERNEPFHSLAALVLYEIRVGFCQSQELYLAADV